MRNRHPLRAYALSHTGIILALALTMQGCGFQLRGSQSLTTAHISSLSLHSTTADDLAREVKSQLQLAGVAVNTGADYTLSLENEIYDRAVLSVSPQTGKAEEFQLTMTARISLARAGNADLISNELISVSHDYLFDEDALLGKASEENALKANLRRQAAADIIRRVHAKTKAN
ncbi:MAG: hypothetical protein HW386_1754 [Gammaproteobacteria bacterium]|nr:hypothetical protein [Gammaproteobacteria bacterium]